MMKRILLSLSALLLLPNLFNFHFYDLAKTKSTFDVNYDKAFFPKIQSIRTFKSVVDSLGTAHSLKKNSLPHAELIDSLTSKRFFFGYSHYSMRENWMAAVAGKLIWNDLGAIVLPEDILNYPMAACSQQSIVLMRLFQESGIPYRKVGFDHHYALEAKVDNKWYYFDPTLSPDFPDGKRISLSEVLDGYGLKTLYRGRIDTNKVDDLLAKPEYSELNIRPAPRARIFHIITKFLSHWLWVLPLLIFTFYYLRERYKWASR